jgi:hypothetical protein
MNVEELIAKVRDSQRTGAQLTMQDGDAIIAALESLRWIPVSERLPDGGRDVLCVSSLGVRSVLSANELRIQMRTRPRLWTHWMELDSLPTPPGDAP